MSLSPRRDEPGKSLLLASGVGAAIACVCLFGLVAIRGAAPGLWSLLAIAIAFAICRVLAAAFGRLVEITPSGAGLFAFVARAFGPSAGVAVVAPYLLLMVLLGALEALLIGHLLNGVWPTLPARALACLFLGLSWMLGYWGIRLGLRVQAWATGLLLLGLLLASGWVLRDALATPGALDRWFAPAPPVFALAGAVAQAVFLFMGFELVCCHVESTRPAKIAWALKGAVLVLALAYGLMALALSVLPPLAGETAGIDALDSPLANARRAGGAPLAGALLGACALASFTSLNGVFLSLSRLLAALGGQGVAPARLARVHAASLAPREAMRWLLLSSLAGVVLIDYLQAYRTVLFAASAAAATLYALLLLARERPPYRGIQSSSAKRASWPGWLLAAGLLLLAVGVIIDAGPSRAALANLLAALYSMGLWAALRLRQARRARAATPRPSHPSPGDPP
jgi:amino acid transporter